jgi:phospholipase A1/A2
MFKRVCLGAAWLLLGASAQAAEGDFLRCATQFKDDSLARLQCYDAQLVPPSAANVPPPLSAPSFTLSAKKSYLDQAWNLSAKDAQERLDCAQEDDERALLQPYRDLYLLPIRSTNRVNAQPASPASAHTLATPYDLDKIETKFQFSLKTDVCHKRVNFLGFDNLRLWVAYTQQSNWQMYNARNSSPFRTTVYEPELIATFSVANPDHLKLVNVGLVHQSNGQSGAESRSWNRLYVQGGWDLKDNVSVLARGWWRIPENIRTDDNPDIQQYLGYGDVVLHWEKDNAQAVTVLLRNNLRMNKNRGFIQIDWAAPQPISNAAQLHFQTSYGYGESLIDYNHPQFTLGLGLSFKLAR